MNIRIVVDDRERASDVPRLLMELGLTVQFSQLAVGDYVLSATTAIERKSLHDFVSSLYDGRLFKQAFKLSEAYRNAILLIEGDLSQIPLFTPNVKSFYGALAALISDSLIKTVFVEGPKESALFISSLAKRLHTRKEKEEIPMVYKPPKGSDIAERQLYVVSALPGIGPKLAHKMLLVLKTPKRIFSASPAEFLRVPGLGRVRAEKLYRFLNMEYEKALRESKAQKTLRDVSSTS